MTLFPYYQRFLATKSVHCYRGQYISTPYRPQAQLETAKSLKPNAVTCQDPDRSKRDIALGRLDFGAYRYSGHLYSPLKSRSSALGYPLGGGASSWQSSAPLTR